MRAWLTVWLPKLGFGALVGAYLATPVVFTRQTAEAFMVPKVTVLWLGLIVATTGAAAWGIAARRWPVPKVSVRWPLLVLVAWTAVATATSTSPVTSFVGQYARYDGFLGVVAGALLVCLVVAYTWRAPGRLGWLVAAQLGAAVLCLGYVAIQQLGWDWIQWLNESLEPIERPYGLLGNSNFSGAHLAMCIPAALALGVRSSHAERGDRRTAVLGRGAGLALAALLALGVWWTGTRGGLLAVVAGVAAAGALVPEVAPKLVRWAAVGLTIAGLVAVGWVSLTVRAGPLDGQVTGSGATPRVLSATTLLDRREIWSAGLRMAADHPLVGVGPDAFGLHMADYRRPNVVAAPPLNADEAHDVLIDRLATAGLPALLTYLWLLATVAAVAWRARRTVPPAQRWLLCAFGGSLGAYLVQGLFSIDVVPLAMVAWVSMGALVALCDPRLADARGVDHPQPIELRPLPLSVSVALVGVALLAGLGAIRPFAADVRFRDGLEANAARRPGLEAAADFRAATTWTSFEPRYHERLGQQLVAVAATGTPDRHLRNVLLREAITAYDHALAAAPGDANALRLKASALVLLASAEPTGRQRHLADAQRIYDDLVRRIPSDPAVQFERGRVLELRGDPAADAAYRRAYELDPGLTAALEGRVRLARADDRPEDALAILEAAHAAHPDDGVVGDLLVRARQEQASG